MVKSADTADLKSADPYQVVGVQVPLRAPLSNWSSLAIGDRLPYKLMVLRYLNLYRPMAIPKAAPNAIPKITPRAILRQIKPNSAPIGSARERAKAIDLWRLFIRLFRLISVVP
jgi:hypothetical protein